MKGRKKMDHKEVLEKRRNFLYKVIFFVILLLFAGFMYIESNMPIDAVYFGVILILFIRFLIIKLYH